MTGKTVAVKIINREKLSKAVLLKVISVGGAKAHSSIIDVHSLQHMFSMGEYLLIGGT